MHSADDPKTPHMVGGSDLPTRLERAANALNTMLYVYPHHEGAYGPAIEALREARETITRLEKELKAERQCPNCGVMLPDTCKHVEDESGHCEKCDTAKAWTGDGQPYRAPSIRLAEVAELRTAKPYGATLTCSERAHVGPPGFTRCNCGFIDRERERG